MQTFITDFDIRNSLNSLDMHRLFSMIYENTHGLGAMLGCVDDLLLSDEAKTQAKKLINKPQCKLWIGYEIYLYTYIIKAYFIWYKKFADKEKTKYNGTTNFKNLEIILFHIYNNNYKYIEPDWITNDLIQTHRSVLIQKEIENEEKIKLKSLEIYNSYCDGQITYRKHDEKMKKLIKQYRKNYHYRKLWPDCPTNLKMHYKWREEKK